MRPYLRVRTLTPDEYATLKRMAQARTLAAGRVQRAQIILLSHQGLTVHDIAPHLGINARTAQRWVGRFNRSGLAGLEEGARTGRPRVYDTQAVGGIIQTALTPPVELGLPFGSWTLDRLVAYLAEVKGITMKRSRISEIFRYEGLRWRHQEGWFGERVDPDFAKKRGPLKPSIPPHQPTV
jgi:transposase